MEECSTILDLHMLKTIACNDSTRHSREINPSLKSSQLLLHPSLYRRRTVSHSRADNFIRPRSNTHAPFCPPMKQLHVTLTSQRRPTFSSIKRHGQQHRSAPRDRSCSTKHALASTTTDKNASDTHFRSAGTIAARATDKRNAVVVRTLLEKPAFV